MIPSRRNLLSAIACALPFGLWPRSQTASDSPTEAPVLRLRSFEDGVRQAFADLGSDPAAILRRIEIGYSEQVRIGIHGSCNDRPFAGFPAGWLRIVRSGFEPGPVQRGVRLYISTVDIVLTDGSDSNASCRPLNFASLPPAPIVF